MRDFIVSYGFLVILTSLNRIEKSRPG